MPHQDNSNRQNLERNLRQSRRANSAPEWADYEVDAETDPRPIADPELEFEADKMGKAHGRKHPGETQFLEGYGTTNFGVSPDDVKRIEVDISGRSAPVVTRTSQAIRYGIILSSVAVLGFLGWNYRERLLAKFRDLRTA